MKPFRKNLAIAIDGGWTTRFLMQGTTSGSAGSNVAAVNAP